MVAFAKQTYSVTCEMCGKTVNIEAYPQDISDWENGELIQSALPYLNADEREILISKTCGECFDRMFGDYSEDES